MTVRSIIFGSFVAIATLPTLAVAAPTAMPDAAATVAAAPVRTTTSRADNPGQRYCIEQDQPASRIRRLDCDTLANWQSQGVDPRLMRHRK